MHRLVQTLTALTLTMNQIGDQGVQYLANVLQQNKVTFSFSLYITHSLLHVDTHYTHPRFQSYK